MKSKLRQVTLLKPYRPTGHIGNPLPKKEIGRGLFHQWGLNYEEFDSGPGTFSTAIIEMPDGSVKNWPADMIRFDDRASDE